MFSSKIASDLKETENYKFSKTNYNSTKIIFKMKPCRLPTKNQLYYQKNAGKKPVSHIFQILICLLNSQYNSN